MWQSANAPNKPSGIFQRRTSSSSSSNPLASSLSLFLYYVQCCKCQHQGKLTDDFSHPPTHTPGATPTTPPHKYTQYQTHALLISLAFSCSVSNPTCSVGLMSDYVGSLIQMDPRSDTHPPHPTPHLTSDLLWCCHGNLFCGDEDSRDGVEERTREEVEGVEEEGGGICVLVFRANLMAG